MLSLKPALPFVIPKQSASRPYSMVQARRAPPNISPARTGVPGSFAAGVGEGWETCGMSLSAVGAAQHSSLGWL